MKRKHKLYVRPKKAYEKTRIKEENTLVNKYGLKNKREIWRTIAKVDYFRRRAKALAQAGAEEQEVFFNKLKKIGLKTETISDVLSLKVENLLERRLPTILVRKNMAKTAQQARQLVAHKKIFIDGKVVNVPSYIVAVQEENKISIKPSKTKAVSEPASENTQSTPQEAAA